MVYIVEATLDVAFNEPTYPVEISTYLYESCMTAPSGSKPMGVFRENRFIDGFKDHPQYFLYQFIREHWQSQRPFFLTSVFLVNVNTACRFGFIGAIAQGANDSVDFFFTESINSIFFINTRRGRAIIGIQVFVSKKVNIRSQQVPE